MHVRWDASVDASARERLEARFRLADGDLLEGSTWRYDLVDPSPDTIRALVRDPAVADTHHIDRSRLTLQDAEPTTRRKRIAHGSVLVAAADIMAAGAAGFTVLLTLVAMSRRPVSRRLWGGVRDLLFRAEGRLPPYASLAFLGVAVYAVALWFPPTDGDDLAYLSSVASTGNPLLYFIGDHGHGNALYRPLTPVSIWAVYQLFGVWALPNQVINLVLHLANNISAVSDRSPRASRQDNCLGLSCGVHISKYTWLAAAWVSDRPMVLTGLFSLLLIKHLSQHAEPSKGSVTSPLSVSLVAALSQVLNVYTLDRYRSLSMLDQDNEEHKQVVDRVLLRYGRF